MKHLIFLSLFWFLFLAGCGNTLKTTNPVPQKNVSFETALPTDTWSYPNPGITIHIGTGLLVKWLNGDDTPEKKYKWTKFKDPYDGQEYLQTIITWYLYTYTYEDLWIKLTTSALYDPYFFNKTHERIYGRYQNMIYHTRWGNTWRGDYIAVFEKHPQTSLAQEIETHHLGAGCKIETGIFDEKTTYYESMIGFDVVYIEDKDWQTTCTYDTQFPQRKMPLVFVMHPKNPNKYYKIATSDWCAPGPCSIFGKIEFF